MTLDDAQAICLLITGRYRHFGSIAEMTAVGIEVPEIPGAERIEVHEYLSANGPGWEIIAHKRQGKREYVYREHRVGPETQRDRRRWVDRTPSTER